MISSEQTFYEALKDLFIGETVEGKSGFINLMKIKFSYYKKFLKVLQSDIEKELKSRPEFREELFAKLYNFFKNYFSESGSIYFNDTPYSDNIYEKVYSNNRDVLLFWKTRMLYYVKSDIQAESFETEIDGQKIFFDVSELEHKKAWEKRDLVFTLKDIKNEVISLKVKYSERGQKTKLEEILKSIKIHGINNVNEDTLEKALIIFQRQNEVDYFINRDVKRFLKEKLNLWLSQYLITEDSEFSAERIKQLKILHKIANSIIDFISQFETELLRIWQKPKFVLNSNYVITFDKIASRNNGYALIKKIIELSNINDQIKEWKSLKIIDENFSPENIIIGTDGGASLNPKYKTLPLDLKYFSEIRLEILSLFENIDDNLDGWLINSENWQALNTILPKFREKVQTIYIDPPFIKTQNADYFYKVNFKDATWMTLLHNRFELAKEFLKPTGSIFVCSDNSCNHYTHELLNEIFKNFRGEIIWCYEKPGGGEKYFKNNHATIYFYSKGDSYVFNPILVPRKGENKLTKREGKFETTYEGKKAPDWWVDIPSFATAMTARERIVKLLGIQFPTQQPERLLQRIIEASSNEGDLIMDFFLGSATSIVVAHKLKRKWIGIELGEHFETVILPRMKIALAGKQKGRADTKLSEDIGWEGGGFFKYYHFEQYEQTLSRAKYEDSKPLLEYAEDPYNLYAFLKDIKLLDSIEIQGDKVKVELSQLYENIDIAETMSNLLGKKIIRYSNDKVELANEITIDTKNLDYKILKPLIWWEN